MDFTAFLYHYCRLGAEVQAAAEEEMAIGTEQGFSSGTRWACSTRGRGCSCRAGIEEAIAASPQGVAVPSGPPGRRCAFPSYLGMLGDAYTQAGRFEDAHKALDEGLAVAEKNDDRCHEAELHRLKGELLLAESPDQMPPPKTASARPSRRPAASRARRGSCGPR